jgi:hypothetical protein
LLPVWGILLFMLLYVVAALLYPGGSDADKTTTGFSWQNNYWCELMASYAQNGKPNTARPVAILAMIVLAVSLIIFWNNIAGLFAYPKSSSRVTQYCGTGSMLVLPFLFTGLHDPVINIAGLLGCIAIISLLTNLYKHKMHLPFYMGIFCLLLCGINNYVYYSKDLLHSLPVIQKISFLIFLLWFILLSVKLYQKTNSYVNTNVKNSV